MPLVRVEVRNEYGLGAPELYGNGNKEKEDPKALLEGVAVSGLVGILRQLGDLAEFAAEVFHGLQEQVMITSSRSHKLMGRVQRIEATLPPLEKLVLAQRSHLHFAYTSGANWHTRIRPEHNHFIYSDLPRFIMDSYEHCQGPPQFSSLDKFDPGGPGSCLKRYSDPSFFRRASSGPDDARVEKILKKKRGRKIKKKSSLHKTRESSRGTSFSNTSGRMQFSSPKMDGQTFRSQAFPLYSERKSDLGEQSVYSGSRYWSGGSDHTARHSNSNNRNEQEDKESLSSPARMYNKECNSYKFVDDKSSVSDDMRHSLSGGDTGPNSFYVNWDGRSEISEAGALKDDLNEPSGTFSMDFDFRTEDSGAATLASKGFDNLDSLQTFQMPVNGEAEDERSSHLSNIEYDNHENLETPDRPVVGAVKDKGTSHIRTIEFQNHENQNTLKIAVDGEAEDKSTSYFRTADYNHACNSGTLPTNSNLETQDTEPSHSRPAMVHGLDQTLDNVSSNFIPDMQDWEASHMETAGKTCTDDGEQSMSISSHNRLGGSKTEVFDILSSQQRNEGVPVLSRDVEDEVESETDNFVDALNAIESDYETDGDVPTKPEVGASDSDNTAVDSEVNIFSTALPRSNPSNLEPLNITSTPDDGATELLETCSGERAEPGDVSNSMPLGSFSCLPSPPVTSHSLDSSNKLDVDSYENIDNFGCSNIASNACMIPSTLNSTSTSTQLNSGVPVSSDKMSSTCSELQNLPPQRSTVTPVKLWTNGGLLGLEPSKPPDFGTLHLSNGVSLEDRENGLGTSSPRSYIKEKKSESVEGTTVPNFSSSAQDDRKGGILMKRASWLFSSADLGTNLQKLSDPCSPSFADNSEQNGTSETHGTVRPVTPDILSTRASQDNSSTSRMFELGNMLLTNGFQRKPSFDKDDNFMPSSSPCAGGFDLKNSSQNVGNPMFSERTKNMLRSGSPFVSPSSSPPLGHMKISFHPINGLETQLQLKFSDSTVNGESGRESRDTFPSFQLVPEPTVTLRDTVSDSENDTFCRSSAYGSDCLSYQSDSNSEQWESDASPSSKNHELYDSLHRISFADLAPTSWDTGIMVRGEVNNSRAHNSMSRNSVENSEFGHIYDLPSLDALQISVMERNDHELRDLTEQQYRREPAPTPHQWRGMKPDVELEDESQFVTTQNLNYSFDRKFGSTISQQPKPAPLKQEQNMETAHILSSKKPDLQKESHKSEVKEAPFQKEVEEKEDFLHQIRTKSFNLRRTATAKPTEAGIVPPSSLQVSALLRKASEIRQAVGSDGEDDTWSDT